MKKPIYEIVTTERFAVGGQVIGTLESGKKVFVWGALPGETVRVRLTKQKSHWAEGIATDVITPSVNRVEPRDPESYLSTSPWQILAEAVEDEAKEALVREAFTQHHIELPKSSKVVPTTEFYGYRNKVEFSWWWTAETDRLDLAFFRRGGQNRIPVEGTSLARSEINEAAIKIRDLLRNKKVEARTLKTLMIRSSRVGEVTAQLYVKDKNILQHISSVSEVEPWKLEKYGVSGFEIWYSDPRSPASRQTELLYREGSTTLTDTLHGVPFTYATEGFFQVNLPVYEKALDRMANWIDKNREVVDFYSGVGTIGLTIGGDNVTLVELDPSGVNEMQRNITALGKNATAVQASSETALDYITSEKTIILDPPRAGLHDDVTERLIEIKPPRIIYLSCNPATQARDVAKLLENNSYKIVDSITFNFFPRTPHIEHLVVLEKV